MLKILKISVLIILIIGLTMADAVAADISSILQAGQEFLKTGDGESATINETQLDKVNSNIFNIFLTAGIIIAVVVGVVLGIQFMTSGIEGQAKIKEAVVPYLVGCVIIFGAFGIWKIVVTIGESTEKDIYTEAAGSERAYEYIDLLFKNNKNPKVGDLVDEYVRAYKSRNQNEYYKAYCAVLESTIRNSIIQAKQETNGVNKANITMNVLKRESTGETKKLGETQIQIATECKECALIKPVR